MITLEQQKLICAEKLKEIHQNISPKDRDDAQEAFGRTERTIIRYLQGQVANVDFGIQLYDFFKKRIEQRQEMLA